MRYKASAKQLLELILIATTLSIGTPPVLSVMS